MIDKDVLIFCSSLYYGILIMKMMDKPLDNILDILLIGYMYDSHLKR
jgi:hypothetical protein